MNIETNQVGDITVVRILEDSLDASNTGKFKEAVAPLLDAKRNVVFDMEKVSFVDSSGLGVILSLLPRLKNSGGDLKLSGVSRQVQVLFELVRLHRLFDIHPTVDEAVEAFKSKDIGV